MPRWLAGEGSPVVIYLAHLHLKRRKIEVCHRGRMCNFFSRNILWLLFSLPVQVPDGSAGSTGFTLGLSGEQALSPGCGEVGVGKPVEMLWGRTCFSEQVGYNSVTVQSSCDSSDVVAVTSS